MLGLRRVGAAFPVPVALSRRRECEGSCEARGCLTLEVPVKGSRVAVLHVRPDDALRLSDALRAMVPAPVRDPL